MKRRKLEYAFECALLLTVVSIFIGAWIFYNFCFPGRVIANIAMSLQNCMETLLFNPTLTINDLVSEAGFIESLNSAEYILIALFSISVVITPFIEVMLVLRILNSILHFWSSVSKKDKRVLIVGYNDEIRQLLKNGTKNFKIYLWTEKLLTSEEERELAIRKITAETNETPLGIQVDYQKLQKKFNKYLEKEKITDVLIMQDSDVANIEYYMMMSDCDICKTKTIRFFVNINNYASKRTLEDFFDSRLKADMNNNKGNPDWDHKMDLKIFNLEQIQSQVIFHKLPLYLGTCKADNYDVHLLIIGSNALAENMLLHAMNQGVITDANRIIIEIFDENTDAIKQRLRDRFNSSYVSEYGNCFAIEKDRSDGQLIIRCLNCNVQSEEFMKDILERTAAMPYTYFVSCLDDPDINLYCYHKFKDIFENIPMALKLPYTWQMKDFINKQKKSGIENRVYLIGTENEYVRLDNIINEAEETDIKEFNHIYINSSVEIKKSCDEEKKESPSDSAIKKEKEEAQRNWNNLLYYKRESNRSLYYHEPNKVFIFEQISDFAEDVSAFWEAKSEVIERLKKVQKNPTDETDGSSNQLNDILKYNCLKSMTLLAKTEHRRFNYFYASEGWGYQQNTKDEDYRLHNCLCRWEELINNPKTSKLLVYDVTTSHYVVNQIEQKKIS